MKKAKNNILEEIINTGGRAFLALPTGYGKTKYAIDYIKFIQGQLGKNKKNLLVYVITYTIQNQISFKEEIVKWKQEPLLDYIKFTTYKSANKIKNKNISIVILDEAHHLTIRSFAIFKNNNIKRVIALSATPPEEEDKKMLFRLLKLHTIERTYNTAIKQKKISDFDVWLYKVNMNADEKVKYKKLNNQIQWLQEQNYSFDKIKWLYLKRMKLLHSVDARIAKAKELMNTLEGRKLIFVPTIDIANSFSKYVYHSKTDSEYLDKFKKEEIDTLVSVVALDEAVNVPKIDHIIIAVFFSKKRRLVQRIGRGVRRDKNYNTKVHIIYVNNSIDVERLDNILEEIDNKKINYAKPNNNKQSKKNS